MQGVDSSDSALSTAFASYTEDVCLDNVYVLHKVFKHTSSVYEANAVDKGSLRRIYTLQ
jgi:hypothetical protein